MPAKKGPILTGRKLPGKPGEGRGRKRPMPIKPGPKGKPGNSGRTLEEKKFKYEELRRKKPTPVKPGPRSERKLPRRVKPGEIVGPKIGPKKRPAPIRPKPAGGSIRDLLYRAKPGEVKKQRVEQIRKSKYDQMIEKGQISVMRRPKLNNENNKLQDMLKGYRSAPDNSKVTYKTRVKPKGFQGVMDAPFRIQKTTVKTGRGR